MGKLLQAKDLLKEKGYVENKFDTNGFMELVSEWFRSQDVKAKLLIRPRRFVELDNPPSCGYIEMLDVDKYCDELPWEQVVIMNQKGELRPFIYVDEPYIKNAVFTLKMFGFIVHKLRNGKFDVTLV